MSTKEKIQKIREEILEKKPKVYSKRAAIIFDGKQYTIRIPRDFAERAQITPEKDEFEFTLEIPEGEEKKDFFPLLYGDVVEKEEKSNKG